MLALDILFHSKSKQTLNFLFLKNKWSEFRQLSNSRNTLALKESGRTSQRLKEEVAAILQTTPLLSSQRTPNKDKKV